MASAFIQSGMEGGRRYSREAQRRDSALSESDEEILYNTDSSSAGEEESRPDISMDLTPRRRNSSARQFYQEQRLAVDPDVDSVVFSDNSSLYGAEDQNTSFILKHKGPKVSSIAKNSDDSSGTKIDQKRRRKRAKEQHLSHFFNLSGSNQSKTSPEQPSKGIDIGDELPRTKPTFLDHQAKPPHRRSFLHHRPAPEEFVGSDDSNFDSHDSGEATHGHPKPLCRKELAWMRSFMQDPTAQLKSLKRDEKEMKLVRMGTSKAMGRTRLQIVTSHLSEDTFSFLISSRFNSIPFITAVFIVSVKATLFGLIAYDMSNDGNESNPMSIPASVTSSVAISQFFAIFIAVATQDDFITSLNLAFEGYSSDLAQAFSGATFWKWAAATASYFLEGALGLIVTFLLIVTSNEVVELLLNFTAIEFVSLLDNVAFVLAMKGFLGLANRTEAERVTKTVYRVRSGRKSSPFQRAVSLFLSAMFLLSGWAYIYGRQVNGAYLPNQITVQFNDLLSPELGAYSGSYYLKNQRWSFDYARITYTSERGGGHFKYCRPKQLWTFAIESDDPCKKYIARSSQTFAFDVTRTASEPWYATADTEDPRFFPMVDFHISIGCIRNDDCGGPGHGTCQHNECVCNDGFFGLRCDYHEDSTCANVAIDESTPIFRGSREFASDYEVLLDSDGRMMISYDHPVYVSKGNYEADHGVDVMMYTGLRWALFEGVHGFKYLDNPTKLEIAEYLEERGASFNVAEELHHIEFVTEPVRFETPLDTVSPTNLHWYSVRGLEFEHMELVLLLDTIMLCGVCDSVRNPCLNGNSCQPDGYCICTNGASGKLCQVRPVRDGHCDHWFNDGAYDYDGGDCCKSTCVSTEEFICGIRNDDGKLETVNIGFPECTDPAETCKGQGCWLTNSKPIPLLSQKAQEGLKSLVTLSANGHILIISEPALDAVRVFDQIDSRWIQRGPLLEGDRDSGFGRKTAITSVPGSVESRRFGKVPIALAILYHYKGFPEIRVERWLPNDVDWRDLHTLKLCLYLEGKNDDCEVCSMDIGMDHDSVTVVVGLKNGKAIVFKSYVTYTGSEPWIVVARHSGDLVSLSGDGHRLATAVSTTDTIDVFRVLNPNASLNQTVLVPIDHHLISQHPIFDADNDIDIDYSGNASHIEKIQLSSDGKYLALAAYGDEGYDFLLRYTVSIDRIVYDSSKPIELPPHIDSEKESGLTSIAFSDDASVAALRYHFESSNDEVQLYEHVLELGGFYGWEPIGQRFLDVSPQEDYSISHDGSIVAFGGRTAAHIHELADRCSHDEIHFRLSITLDAYPANVSWALDTMRQLGDLQIRRQSLRDCDHCYDDNERFGKKSIIEEVCVPKEEQNCLRLSFQAEHGFAEGSGFVALIEGIDVMKYEESGTEPVVWLPDSRLAEECQVPMKDCLPSESLLVLALSLDRHEEETSWDLIDTDYRLIAHGGDYTPELAATTVIEEVCIPNDRCVAFTIHDKYGDGSCCDYGKGGYTIWLDGELVERNEGRFGSKRRVLIGQECPIHDTCTGLVHTTADGRASDMNVYDDDALYYDSVCEVVPIECYGDAVSLVLEMTHDFYPEEVGWTLYDSKYNVLGAGGNYVFDDITKTSIHQLCVPRDECLSFVFEDSIGDGEHEGRGFIVYLDGEEVLNRHESSVGRERDDFGFNCPETSPVTVAIVFDDHPQETGFSIVDNAGFPVIEVFPHTYTQEYDGVEMTFELIKGELYRFTVLDDDGDGMCCAFGFGSYSIFLGEHIDSDRLLVVGNGLFEWNTTHYFLNSEDAIISVDVPWQKSLQNLTEGSFGLDGVHKTR